MVSFLEHVTATVVVLLLFSIEQEIAYTSNRVVHACTQNWHEKEFDVKIAVNWLTHFEFFNLKNLLRF